VTAPCNVASGIMTVNSPSGSTLQCHTWLWDDVPLNSPGGSTLQCGRWLWDDSPCNSPKRPPYWNSTSGLDFDHVTAVDISFCTSLRNFIQIGPPSAEKMTSCRYSRSSYHIILNLHTTLENMQTTYISDFCRAVSVTRCPSVCPSRS